jgi:enoyl-CoA hydratase/carnithine racemase
VKQAWSAFFRAALALARSPLPLVAALAGHAPAGGCVLALCCDSRVLADQGARIGLNEVQLGLPLPTPIRLAYDFVLGTRLSALHGALGTLFEPAEALAIGLVDELAPAADVLGRALARARAYAALPPLAVARTRREARAPLVAALAAADSVFVDGIVETWFSAETRTGMQAALAALAKRAR